MAVEPWTPGRPLLGSGVWWSCVARGQDGFMSRGRGPLWQTADMTQWAVTVNLGGERQSEGRKDGMIAWTKRALRERRPAVFFAQESFSRWLGLLDEHEDYEVIKGVDRGWSVQSVLVHRSDLKLEPLIDIDLPNLSYHGTTWPLLGGTDPTRGP